MVQNDDILPVDDIFQLLITAKSHRIYLKDLAAESGFSKCTMSNWKRGITTPTLIHFNMLKDALRRLIEKQK